MPSPVDMLGRYLAITEFDDDDGDLGPFTGRRNAGQHPVHPSG